MAKLHRRIVDSSAPRGPRIPAPRVTRRFPRLGGVRRPRFSLPGFAIFTPAIPWARMLPGRRGVMNFAVAGSLVFCGYAALLLIRDIQERPPAPILERPVAVSTPARFTPVPEGERIRVEVLNGVGVPGIAGALAETTSRSQAAGSPMCSTRTLF